LSHILSSTCQNSRALFVARIPPKLVGGMRHLSKGIIPLVWNLSFLSRSSHWSLWRQPMADVMKNLFSWRQPMADVIKNLFSWRQPMADVIKNLFSWRQPMADVIRHSASSWRHQKSRYKISLFGGWWCCFNKILHFSLPCLLHHDVFERDALVIH
jgi:ABC-type polysaccharide/polyol phosphate export permease